MVLKGEDDTALLCLGQTFLYAVDAPFETVVESVALEDGFLAAQFHEVVEVARRASAARVEPDAGDAHLVGQLDAFLGMFDVLLAGFGRRLHEVLVDG